MVKKVLCDKKLVIKTRKYIIFVKVNNKIEIFIKIIY